MKRNSVALVAGIALILSFTQGCGGGGGTNPPPANTLSPGFNAVGSMTVARYLHTATKLVSGKVLIAGGYGLDSAEIYDPATRLFTATTGTMHSARYNHTATLLSNGMVLIAGGKKTSLDSPLDTAEVFDPATGTFTLVTNLMKSKRAGHTAIMLVSGKVILIGGDDGSTTQPFTPTAAAEIYDPASGPATATFTLTGSMSVARASPTTTRLTNGDILVAGGSNYFNYLNSSETYSPSGGTFTTGANLTVARAMGVRAVLLMASNDVLLTGGYTGTYLDSADLYTAGTFTSGGTMTQQRRSHTMTVLNSGKVLIAGGENPTRLKSAELYDPSTRTYTAIGNMLSERADHTETLLQDGTVLLTGGNSNSATMASAELYKE
jgi:hypothetical protein